MKLAELAYFSDNVSEMIAFYETLLEAKPVVHSESMAIFMIGGTKLFIHSNYKEEGDELPPANHIAFEVSDVDVSCQQLVEAGLFLERSPQNYYWGRSAYLRDPDGQQIELTQA